MIFRTLFGEKVLLQISHLKYFIVSWTVAICLRKLPLCKNLVTHFNFFPSFRLYVSENKYFSGVHGLKNKQNVDPSFTQRYLIQNFLFPIFNIHQLRVVLSPEVDKSRFNNVPANYIQLQVRAELGWFNFKTWNFDFEMINIEICFEIFSCLSIGDWVLHI